MNSNRVSNSEIAITFNYSLALGDTKAGILECKTGPGANQRATSFYAGSHYIQVPLPVAECLILLLIAVVAIFYAVFRCIGNSRKRITSANNANREVAPQ